jgi:hypothetical protein
LTGLGALNGNQWSFALFPGWRDVRDAPLEEICARQYVACNEAALRARAEIDTARWIDVSYEDLVRDPAEELRALCEKLDLPFGREAEAHAADLAGNVSRTALSAPREEKWRERNPEAIERMLPVVAETERRLGYPSESATGAGV